MNRTVMVCSKEYTILALLGHGKGGYSYLALSDDRRVVLKQIHHEPCDYYEFGNKIETEIYDYRRLKDAGIRIPAMLAADRENERIVKEYVEGETVFDLVRKGEDVSSYVSQVRDMAELAKSAGLNIDYFPTNFVVNEGTLWYVDYECNEYMEQWDLDNWGLQYWSMTPRFAEHLARHPELDRKYAVIYVHGQGGSADEASHYRPLFPSRDVFGFDYRSRTPWEAREEFPAYFSALNERYERIILVANSIGAFFCLSSRISRFLTEAYLISPVLDMEKLILEMMARSGVSEDELRQKGTFHAPGADLSWEYLEYVRSLNVQWDVPTRILYGSLDALTPMETARQFTDSCGCRLTVMEGGEHWFHTEEQMAFLDRWIAGEQNV